MSAGLAGDSGSRDIRRYSPNTSPASPGVNTRLPGAGRPCRLDKFGLRRRLHQISAGPRPDGVEYVLAFVGRRQTHEDPRARGDTVSTAAVACTPLPSGNCISISTTSGHRLGPPGTGGHAVGRRHHLEPSSARSRATPSPHIG